MMPSGLVRYGRGAYQTAMARRGRVRGCSTPPGEIQVVIINQEVKMIRVLTCDGVPDLYFKDKTEAEVLKEFAKGLKKPLETYTKNPSFKIRVLTLALLEELVPDDFQINDDTSF
jgi:hypothetical protein